MKKQTQQNNKKVWRLIKRTSVILAVISLLVGTIYTLVLLGVIIKSGTPPNATSNTPPLQTTSVPLPTPMPSFTPTPSPTPTPPPMTLEDDISQWNTNPPPETGIAKLENVVSPSVDGTALKISLLSRQPSTDIQAYLDSGPADAATHFDLNLSFYLSSVAPIQALRFSISQWVKNQRWELAFQWEHISDRSPAAGNPPTWRLWTGQGGWQDTKLRQQLSVKTWHNLHLKGEIVNGKVHYISFNCDNAQADLTQTPMFAPVSNQGDKLVIAIELDGDNKGDPYDVYIDGVTFTWS